MFDFAWSEIALIGVVALIAIGPKDMPVAIKAVAEMIKKARRMAGEFQTHVDEMVREANLDEVRNQISEIRNFDIKGAIEKAVDSDGSIRKTFSENPLATPYTPPIVTPPPAADEALTGDVAVAVAPAEAGAILSEPEVFDHPSESDRSMGIDWSATAAVAPAVEAAGPQAPAFIPPSIASPPVPPAFIPPGISPPSA